MDEQKFEGMLQQLLAQDLSAGTETFRDELLARCLDLLGTDDAAVHDMADAYELADSDLELLAAAGDPSSIHSSSSICDDGAQLR